MLDRTVVAWLLCRISDRRRQSIETALQTEQTGPGDETQWRQLLMRAFNLFGAAARVPGVSN